MHRAVFSFLIRRRSIFLHPCGGPVGACTKYSDGGLQGEGMRVCLIYEYFVQEKRQLQWKGSREQTSPLEYSTCTDHSVLIRVIYTSPEAPCEAARKEGNCPLKRQVPTARDNRVAASPHDRARRRPNVLIFAYLLLTVHHTVSLSRRIKINSTSYVEGGPHHLESEGKHVRGREQCNYAPIYGVRHAYTNRTERKLWQASQTRSRSQ